MRISAKYKASGALHRKIQGKVTRSRRLISAAVVALWRTKIDGSTLSSRAKRRYSRAITAYVPPRAGAYISEKVAVLLERGWKRFDMAPGLLRGKSYARIPVKGGVRTVSVHSPTKSWVHPGFAGAKVASRVERGIGKVVKGVLARVK